MALKLDELVSKRKEGTQSLDLSRVVIKSKEDFEKYFDKIPEFKIRPEKVRAEDGRVRDGDFSFVSSRKEAVGRSRREFSYADPIPPSMRSVRLEDLAAVEINWRMLTLCRPKSKLEEDIFSRVVELGKLRLSTRRHEAKVAAASGAGLPAAQAHLSTLGLIASKTKRGTTETRMKTCRECGEELCQGRWCKEAAYDAYTRMLMDKDDLAQEEAEEFAPPTRRTAPTKSKRATLPKGPRLRGRRRRKKKRARLGTRTKATTPTHSSPTEAGRSGSPPLNT